MSGTILFVGEYQLRNLIKNQVVFLYFDLRESGVSAGEKSGDPLFQNSQNASEDELPKLVSEQASSKDHPIVLICENGEKSMRAALELEKLGYLNVFVLRGGTSSLDLSAN